MHEFNLIQGGEASQGLKNGRILVCAHSNVATDNLLEGLLETGCFNGRAASPARIPSIATVVTRTEKGNDHTVRDQVADETRYGAVVRLGRPTNVRSHLWNHTLDAMLQRDPEWCQARARLDAAVSSYNCAKYGTPSSDAAPQTLTTPGDTTAMNGSSEESVVERDSTDNSQNGSGDRQGVGGAALGAAQRELATARRLLDETEQSSIAAILEKAEVVVSTCIGAGSNTLERFVRESGVQYRSVLVDEAAQVFECEIINDLYI